MNDAHNKRRLPSELKNNQILDQLNSQVNVKQLSINNESLVRFNNNSIDEYINKLRNEIENAIKNLNEDRPINEKKGF